jgi:(p)ppGpp synthase/HD superfamily hydrolase
MKTLKQQIDSINKMSMTLEGCETMLRDLAAMGHDIDHAITFAVKAHKGQVRKYSNMPYISHVLAVATIVSLTNNDPEMIKAAILHDTVEDTSVTLQDVEKEFGSDVAQLVEELTDISTPEMGNRKTRKAIDREHTSAASVRGKSVKLADLIHNSYSIMDDKGFAKVWMREKEQLLDVLKDADPELREIALNNLKQELEKLRQYKK